MSRYSVWQALVMAFYSKPLYRDVARRWGAKTFLYLLLLLAISWIPFTTQMQIVANQSSKQFSDLMVSQVPVVTIENGIVRTPENRPYIITSPDSNERLAVIDTSGQITTLEQAQAQFLITKNQIINQPKTNETRIYDIPNTLNMVIDPQAIKNYIPKYLWLVWIILFIIFTFGSYIYRLIQALIYALLGKIMCGMEKVQLSYGECLQLSMVAITPAVLLSMVLDFFFISFPFKGLIYFLITMGYLYFAIKANKEVDTDVKTTEL